MNRSTLSRLLPIALSQAVGLACGLVSVAITTHWVPPEVWGRYALFLTLVPLGMWVFHAGWIKGLTRNWASCADRRELVREVGRGLWRGLPLFTVATVAVSFALLEQDRAFLLPLVWLAALLGSATTLAQSSLQAVRDHWADFAASATGSLTRSFLPPLLFVALGGTALALPLGFFGHALLTCLIALALARRHITPATSPHEPLDRAYTGPLFLALAAVHWTISGLNRWVSAAWFGDTFTGHLALAGNIAMLPTSMLGVIVIQLYQPSLYALPHSTTAERRDLARRLDRVALLYTSGGLVGLALLDAVLPRLIGLWIAPTYAPALPWIFPLGCFTLAILLGQWFQAGLLAARRESACGPIELVAAAVTIGGTIATASIGETPYRVWLYASLGVPWVINRTGLRRALGRSTD